MKGSIAPNHIPVNKYQFLIVGLPPLTAIEVSGIEEELQVIDMPDRTKASGGNSSASECTIKIPMHHTIEIAAMEAWFLSGKDPIQPNYKKSGSLLLESISPVGPTRAYNINGVFVTKRMLPDLEQANDGDMASAEFTLSIDEIFPS